MAARASDGSTVEEGTSDPGPIPSLEKSKRREPKYVRLSTILQVSPKGKL
jgi:hypothetical protein